MEEGSDHALNALHQQGGGGLVGMAFQVAVPIIGKWAYGKFTDNRKNQRISEASKPVNASPSTQDASSTVTTPKEQSSTLEMNVDSQTPGKLADMVGQLITNKSKQQELKNELESKGFAPAEVNSVLNTLKKGLIKPLPSDNTDKIKVRKILNEWVDPSKLNKQIQRDTGTDLDDIEFAKCEDLTCCPPPISRFSSSYEFRMSRLNEEMSFATKMLSFFGFLVFFLGSILIYLGTKLTKIIMRYFDIRKERANKKQHVKQSAGSTRAVYNNPANDNFDDDYILQQDRSQFAERQDDYNQFTNTMEKSIEKYKEYNNRVRDFFIKNGLAKKMDLSSQIDDTIFDKKYDQW